MKLLEAYCSRTQVQTEVEICELQFVPVSTSTLWLHHTSRTRVTDTSSTQTSQTCMLVTLWAAALLSHYFQVSSDSASLQCLSVHQGTLWSLLIFLFKSLPSAASPPSISPEKWHEGEKTQPQEAIWNRPEKLQPDKEEENEETAFGQTGAATLFAFSRLIFWWKCKMCPNFWTRLYMEGTHCLIMKCLWTDN